MVLTDLEKEAGILTEEGTQVLARVTVTFWYNKIGEFFGNATLSNATNRTNNNTKEPSRFGRTLSYPTTLNLTRKYYYTFYFRN